MHLIFDFVILSTLMNVGLYLIQGDLGELTLEETYKFQYLWFLYDYILLAILSPFIERLIKRMSMRTYTILIICLTLINVIACYGFRIINSDGYGLLNFIYLYLLARYIRLLNSNGKLKKINPFAYTGIYIGVSLIAAGIYFIIVSMGYNDSLGGTRFFSYNNPLFLLSSVCLIMAITSAKPFYSNGVNLFATGVFTVYIMQSSMQLCPIRNTLAKMIFADYSYCGLLLLGTAILVGCSAIGIMVEWMWKMIELRIGKILDVWNNIG